MDGQRRWGGAGFVTGYCRRSGSHQEPPLSVPGACPSVSRHGAAGGLLLASTRRPFGPGGMTPQARASAFLARDGQAPGTGSTLRPPGFHELNQLLEIPLIFYVPLNFTHDK